MTELQGLSASEVSARRASGLGNEVQFQITRTYWQIIRQNAFTFINTILFAIGILLVLLGQLGDALVTAGLVLMNVIAGVIQEGRAKHKLEQIALLTRPKATVIRDGQEQTIDPGEVVQGDVLVTHPGDQIVVDGLVIESSGLAMDESLLTGESDHVRKQIGDSVYSGSFCVRGSAYYQAEKVGKESLVNQLTAQARVFRQVKTPLQRDIDFIIRILVVLAAQLGTLIAISYIMQSIPLVDSVRVAAVIVALVPQGLFFMTTVAYAMGVLRVSGQGALIQQINAVESISNVDLLCLDKTGTLTTNRIQLRELQPIRLEGFTSETDLKRILGDYVTSAADRNRTSEAIREACGGSQMPVKQAVPFSAERKWSAQVFEDERLSGVYVLGAPEVLQANTRPDGNWATQVEKWSALGLRVLLLAHSSSSAIMEDENGEAQLPSMLDPVGLVSLQEELRAEARETLEHLNELNIDLKIISGDNPNTVAALCRQVGVIQADRITSGLELQNMDQAQFEHTVLETTIFGRITPQQKERILGTLKDHGRYVAMIGDGVNDVLALKQANVGVAMENGSQAARGVADIVLLNDSFAALPSAFREGQRIVKGMEDVVRLLLTRTLYVTMLVIATQIVGLAFPVTPKHNSILALLTVGIPILALAAWARPGSPPRSVIRSTSHFVFPAAFSVSVLSFGVYLFYLGTNGNLALARSALTTATVFCGLVLILFVEPPVEAWVGGDVLSGDWRPTVLAIGLLLFYGLILGSSTLRNFFELVPLGWLDYVLIVTVVTVWAIVLRWVWRARLFERFLSV
jgi:cation-transporting P-type ATPase E